MNSDRTDIWTTEWAIKASNVSEHRSHSISYYEIKVFPHLPILNVFVYKIRALSLLEEGSFTHFNSGSKFFFTLLLNENFRSAFCDSCDSNVFLLFTGRQIWVMCNVDAL